MTAFNPETFVVLCVYQGEWENFFFLMTLFYLQKTYSKEDNAHEYYMKGWKVCPLRRVREGEVVFDKGSWEGFIKAGGIWTELLRKSTVHYAWKGEGRG